jgi:hypothetical protein
MPVRCILGKESKFFKVSTIHRGTSTGQHKASMSLRDYVLSLHETHERPTEIIQIPKFSIHQLMDVAGSYDLP